MAIIQIMQFDSSSISSEVALEVKIQQISQHHLPEHVTISTKWQEPHIVQVVVERDAASSLDPLTQELDTLLGKLTNSFHVDVNPSPFTSPSPATVDYVEYVTTFFPVSKATPEFRESVVTDFMRFNEIVLTECKEYRIGISIGWSEELDAPEIQGEKAVAFFATTGWKTLAEMDRLMQTEAFAKAQPIVMGWGAPFKMVRIWGCSEQVSG